MQEYFEYQLDDKLWVHVQFSQYPCLYKLNAYMFQDLHVLKHLYKFQELSFFKIIYLFIYLFWNFKLKKEENVKKYTSDVVPPAPQVTSMNSGPSWYILSILSKRFSTPYYFFLKKKRKIEFISYFLKKKKS